MLRHRASKSMKKNLMGSKIERRNKSIVIIRYSNSPLSMIYDISRKSVKM